MISWIRKMFWKCYDNRVLRYIFFGGLTTLVNLCTYYLLRLLLHVSVTPANIVSVITAILFAYFVNSRFVFETKAEGFTEHFQEFVKFISARGVTMIIEVGGVWLLTRMMSDYMAKLIIQFIILILNYIFSKFLVFTGRSTEGGN